MGYAAVIFDWTGTLAAIPRGNFAMALERSLALLPSVDRAPAGWPGDYVRRGFREPKPAESATEAFENALSLARAEVGPAVEMSGEVIELAARRFAFEAVANHVVYDDARALLASLKYRGYRCGIASNLPFPGEHLREALGALGLAGYVERCVTSADTGRPKPDPSVITACIEAMGVAPAEAIFVGDSASDVEAGHAAGVQVIRLDRDDDGAAGDDVARIRSLSGLTGVLGETLR